jgi:hypothetical protein
MPVNVNKTVPVGTNAVSNARLTAGSEVGVSTISKLTSEAGKGALKLGAYFGTGLVALGVPAYLLGKGAVGLSKETGLVDKNPLEKAEEDLKARQLYSDYVNQFYDSNGLPSAVDPRYYLAKQMYDQGQQAQPASGINWLKVVLSLTALGAGVGGAVYLLKKRK